MADIISAIVDVLKADAGVTGLAATHVYGDELAPDATALMPRAAIVIQASGGVPFQPASKLKLETQRFDLVAYGATPHEADRLRRLGYDALRAIERQVAAGVMIHWVQSAGGMLAGRDRDGKWPFAFQSFQTLFASEEIT